MSAFNGRHGDKLYVLGYPEFVGLDVVQADGARASVNLETDIAEFAALEILKVAGAKWMGVEGGPSTIQVISDDTTDDELMATLLDRFTAATRAANGHEAVTSVLPMLGIMLVMSANDPTIKNVVRALLGVPLND